MLPHFRGIMRGRHDEIHGEITTNGGKKKSYSRDCHNQIQRIGIKDLPAHVTIDSPCLDCTMCCMLILETVEVKGGF